MMIFICNNIERIWVYFWHFHHGYYKRGEGGGGPPHKAEPISATYERGGVWLSGVD